MTGAAEGDADTVSHAELGCSICAPARNFVMKQARSDNV